ncbi:glycosyltransferase [Flavobacterium hydrophilum]|uniref:Glycosyltransferase n=1 Tax=Flavobacterium hydrophilum TaxID=2211445 RepID=A0A2V4C2E8_9FLAO|nr:glycosyltransferase [Flavobacterium hydrophilum]PXY44060.1 glycosyltransferase [Flavobacterium hydrophilum]
MKVAIFIYSLAGGGAERIVSQLVPYLESKELDVYLVLMNNTCAYSFTTKREPFFLEHSKPTENGILKLLKIPLLAYKYHVLLKKNNIEKSISFLTRPGFISVLTKFFNKQRTIIISERSNSSNQYGYKNLQSWINIFLIKKLYPIADLIITNSKGNAEDLISNFNVPSHKLFTVYNPVSIKTIDAIESKKDFFDKNFFNLISVGRLDKGKNHQLLIRSVEKLKDKKVRLYIFGDGELKNELQRLIGNLRLEKSVFLMGFDSNPYQYLKAADLFVFSSNHEGFPNVLLEAMTCSLPIISTNCPSGPNEILEAEIEYDFKEIFFTKYGLLIPRNDEQKMTEAIVYMMGNVTYYADCKASLKKRILDFENEKILENFYNIFSA